MKTFWTSLTISNRLEVNNGAYNGLIAIPNENVVITGGS